MVVWIFVDSIEFGLVDLFNLEFDPGLERRWRRPNTCKSTRFGLVADG